MGIMAIKGFGLSMLGPTVKSSAGRDVNIDKLVCSFRDRQMLR